MNYNFNSYFNKKLFFTWLIIVLILTIIINIINYNYKDFLQYSFKNPIFNSNLEIPKSLIHFEDQIDVFN